MNSVNIYSPKFPLKYSFWVGCESFGYASTRTIVELLSNGTPKCPSTIIAFLYATFEREQADATVPTMNRATVGA